MCIRDSIAGAARGGELVKLSTATIRAVAQGVIVVAFIQAIIVGLAPVSYTHLDVYKRQGRNR